MKISTIAAIAASYYLAISPLYGFSQAYQRGKSLPFFPTAQAYAAAFDKKPGEFSIIEINIPGVWRTPDDCKTGLSSIAIKLYPTAAAAINFQSNEANAESLDGKIGRVYPCSAGIIIPNN